jgi:hypothetical protein
MAVVGVAAASAQIVWGGRVGLCYPTVSTSEGESISGNAGVEVGPTLYYALKENIYLNSGAMFSIKTFDFGRNASLNLYYIDIPLYVGYAFPLGGLDFYAQAGPYIGIKLTESIEVNTSSDDDMVDEGSGIGSFNAGLGLAGGINIKRFKVELGYQQGLTNVYDAQGSDDGNFKITLGSMFIGVSYIF